MKSLITSVSLFLSLSSPKDFPWIQKGDGWLETEPLTCRTLAWTQAVMLVTRNLRFSITAFYCVLQHRDLSSRMSITKLHHCNCISKAAFQNSLPCQHYRLEIRKCPWGPAVLWAHSKPRARQKWARADCVLCLKQKKIRSWATVTAQSF